MLLRISRKTVCRQTTTKWDSIRRDRRSEHLGGVSLYVAGPDCMKGVSVAVWDAAHKHIEKLTQPIVLRAIGHAQMGDDLTR